MNGNRVLLLIILLAALALTSACVGGGGAFTIKDSSFAASNACDGEGVLEFQVRSGELRVAACGSVQASYRQSGMPSAWCHGFKHVWIGQATHAGYIFESSPDDPLQFVVDRGKGYRYERGSGTVTTPDGKVVTLP